MENKLISKIKFGINDQFAKTIYRDNYLDNENPGPGEYINPDIIASENFKKAIL